MHVCITTCWITLLKYVLLCCLVLMHPRLRRAVTTRTATARCASRRVGAGCAPWDGLRAGALRALGGPAVRLYSCPAVRLSGCLGHGGRACMTVLRALSSQLRGIRRAGSESPPRPTCPLRGPRVSRDALRVRTAWQPPENTNTPPRAPRIALEHAVRKKTDGSAGRERHQEPERRPGGVRELLQRGERGDVREQAVHPEAAQPSSSARQHSQQILPGLDSSRRVSSMRSSLCRCRMSSQLFLRNVGWSVVGGQRRSVSTQPKLLGEVAAQGARRLSSAPPSDGDSDPSPRALHRPNGYLPNGYLVFL